MPFSGLNDDGSVYDGYGNILTAASRKLYVKKWLPYQVEAARTLTLLHSPHASRTTRDVRRLRHGGDWLRRQFVMCLQQWLPQTTLGSKDHRGSGLKATIILDTMCMNC